MLVRKVDALIGRIPLLEVLSSKKLIRNQFLNYLGVQPFRVWLAELRYQIRPKYISPDIFPVVEKLRNDGIVQIENFLPMDRFLPLEKECHDALAKITRSRVRQDGPNIYSNISQDHLFDYPEIMQIFNDSKIEKLFRAAERRNLKLNQIVRLLSCLEQGEDNGKQDPETELHEDTFFNTHKAWLYITNVTEENAPFVYVKGSHKHFKVDRYRKSYSYSRVAGNIHSRRITKLELEEAGLQESILLARKNTLVIANTLGFHRRLRGSAGGIRIAIAFSARFNPFI